jgi:hypothetical protein
VLAGPARKRDAAVNALSWVREKIDDPNLSFDDLYAIRQDIGDAMAGRLSNDKIKGIQYARKEVNAIKRSIDQTLNKMSGGKFGEYNRTWAGMSRPIEQMKAGQEIMAKGEARAMDIRGNPVIKPQDIRGYMVKKGEGKFGPVFSDEQQGVLSALAGDIERSNIVDAVRPRGSDTFQNLAQNEALKRAMGGSAPVALQEAMRKTLGWLYTGPDEAIQGVLINALRDPAEAARLLSMAPDEATRSTIRKALAEYSRQAAQRVPLGIPAAAVNSD